MAPPSPCLYTGVRRTVIAESPASLTQREPNEDGLEMSSLLVIKSAAKCQDEAVHFFPVIRKSNVHSNPRRNPLQSRGF